MPVDSAGFRRMVTLAPKAIREASLKVNAKSANDMASHLRRIVPKRSGLLLSTVTVTADADGGHTVSMGGEKTQRTIGKRTYVSKVEVGAGKNTNNIASKAGGHRVVWDYARLIEFGSKKVKKDPSFVPARRRAAKLHRRRMRTAVNKVARQFSGK